MNRIAALLAITSSLLVSGGCVSLANKDDVYLLKTEMNEEISSLRLSVNRLEEEIRDLRGQVDFVKTDTANQMMNLSADVSSRLGSIESARTKDKEEISKKFSVVLDEVSGASSSKTPAARRAPKAIPPGAATYVVRTGDTISKIARQFGVGYQDLMEANGLEDPNHLAIGDRLVIPGAAPSASSSAE